MKSSPHHQILNYLQWDSGDETAVFAIEYHASDTALHSSKIVRHYSCNDDFLHEDFGLSLGETAAVNSVLLIKACAGDVMTLRDTFHGSPRSVRYRVGIDYALEVVSEAVALSEVEIRKLLQNRHTIPHGGLRVNEKDLEVLFRLTHPEWLNKVLKEQLAHWRTHHAEHYFHYVPLDLSAQEIFHGVRRCPLWILARFRGRLNSMQRTLCCNRTPLAAIFLEWPVVKRDCHKRRLSQYAAEILKFASDRFSEEDVLFCAQLQPLVALEFLPYLDSLKQDAALAGIVSSSFSKNELGNQSERWKTGIIASVHRFPSIWVTAFGGNFFSMFSVLRNVPGSQQDGSLVQMMQDTLKGKEKYAFEEYICSIL